MNQQFTPLNIVLTGGNSGVGYQTVKYLYTLGHNVIFGSRNQTKNAQAINSIIQAQKSHVNPSNAIHFIKSFPLDLSKRQSISSFSQFIKSQFKQKVDILINNAGLVVETLVLNQDNIEMTLAVNHFGHFYLTYLLFELLKNSQQARIINVSSMMHFKSPNAILDDMKCENKAYQLMEQYNISKIMNVLFTQELYRKIQKEKLNMLAVCLHPGFVYTNFGREIQSVRNLVESLKHMTIPPVEGAKSSIYLATQEFNKIKNGEYYNDKAQHQQMDERARDQKTCEQLWGISEKIYGIKFL